MHGSIESRFSPYHLLVEASTAEELNSEKILHTVSSCLEKKVFSDNFLVFFIIFFVYTVRTLLIFLVYTVSLCFILDQLMETAGTKSKVLDDGQLPQRQMRGFTQTQVPQRDRKANFGVSAVSAKGAEVEILPEVAEAVARVRLDGDPATWMVAGYRDANPKGENMF